MSDMSCRYRLSVYSPFKSADIDKLTKFFHFKLGAAIHLGATEHLKGAICDVHRRHSAKALAAEAVAAVHAREQCAWLVIIAHFACVTGLVERPGSGEGVESHHFHHTLLQRIRCGPSRTVALAIAVVIAVRGGARAGVADGQLQHRHHAQVATAAVTSANRYRCFNPAQMQVGPFAFALRAAAETSC